MDKMDADIKTIARSIIQGNEKRKKRIKTKKASAFDIKAAAIVNDALCGRRQFYEYRTEFITLVAQAMDMLPEQKGKEHGN